MKQNEQTETEKAMDLLKDRGVLKFDDFELENHYRVIGKTGEYLVVLPKFCTCDHFVFRCLKTPEKVCYHILAAKFARNIPLADKEKWNELIFSK